MPGCRSVPAAAGMVTPSGSRSPSLPAATTLSYMALLNQAGAVVDVGTAHPPSNRCAPGTGGVVDVELDDEELDDEATAAPVDALSRASDRMATAAARILVIRIPRPFPSKAAIPPESSSKRRTGGRYRRNPLVSAASSMLLDQAGAWMGCGMHSSSYSAITMSAGSSEQAAHSGS